MCVNDKTSCKVLKQFSHRWNRLSMLIFIWRNKVKFDLCTAQEELMVSLAFEGTLHTTIIVLSSYPQTQVHLLFTEVFDLFVQNL